MPLIDSGRPIRVEKYFSPSAVPTPKVYSATKSSGNNWNVGVQVTDKPSLNAQVGGEIKSEFTIDNVPTTHQAHIRDSDGGMRWILVNDLSSTTRLGSHWFHHRINRHLPVKASIRVSCLCRKVSYTKPEGDGRLEILLKEESAGDKARIGPACQ
jgi:hypothetical protein